MRMNRGHLIVIYLMALYLVSCGNRAPNDDKKASNTISESDAAKARDFANAPQYIIVRVSKTNDEEKPEVRALNTADLSSAEAVDAAFNNQGTSLPLQEIGIPTSTVSGQGELNTTSSTGSYWFSPQQQASLGSNVRFISDDDFFGPRVTEGVVAQAPASQSTELNATSSTNSYSHGGGGHPGGGGYHGGGHPAGGGGYHGGGHPGGGGYHGGGYPGGGYHGGYYGNRYNYGGYRPIYPSYANWGYPVYYGYSSPYVYPYGNYAYNIYARPFCLFNFCIGGSYYGGYPNYGYGYGNGYPNYGYGNGYPNYGYGYGNPNYGGYNYPY